MEETSTETPVEAPSVDTVEAPAEEKAPVESPAEASPPSEPVKVPVEEAKEETILQPQYEPMEKLKADIFDLEQDLFKKYKEVKESGQLDQHLNELIRLEATRALQKAQMLLADILLRLEEWDKVYHEFLKERHGMYQAKAATEGLSKIVEQDRLTLYKLKGLGDLDFQRLVILCSLPDDRFRDLMR